jgi:hypothetical protein
MPRLPIAPFRAWLESRLTQCDALTLSERLGVSERTLKRWRVDLDDLDADYVDDILTREGSTALWELGEYGFDKHGRQIYVPRTPEMDAYRVAAEGNDGPLTLDLDDAYEYAEPSRPAPATQRRHIRQPWEPRPSRHEALRQRQRRAHLAGLQSEDDHHVRLAA